MECPVCKNQISDTSRICPFCQTNLTYQAFVKPSISKETPVIKNIEEKHKWDKGTLFCLMIVILGSILLLLLVLSLLSKKEKTFDYKTTSPTTELPTPLEKTSMNKGILSSFRYPLQVQTIGLATFVDKQNNKETDVDILGLRFLNEEEKASLIANANEPLKEGFVWEALAYEIRFNDLDYLNEKTILPSMETKVYLPTGCDFVVIGEHNVLLHTHVFGEEKQIKNHESISMQVLYQIPENTNHSICIGTINKKMACFSK